MIRLSGVSRSFAGRSGTVEALHDIDLEAGDGEFVAVVGAPSTAPNTSKKSLAAAPSCTSC